MNRITNIKIFDKSLHEYSYFDIIDKLEFKSFTYNRILAIIPQNLINIFNKDYKKIEYQIATGSYLEQKIKFQTNRDLNTGSYLVEDFIMPKNNSYILSFIVIFIIFNSSFYILSNFQNIEKNKITYSPLIFILFLIFNKLTISDNLLAIISNLIRNL